MPTYCRPQSKLNILNLTNLFICIWNNQYKKIMFNLQIFNKIIQDPEIDLFHCMLKRQLIQDWRKRERERERERERVVFLCERSKERVSLVCVCVCEREKLLLVAGEGSVPSSFKLCYRASRVVVASWMQFFGCDLGHRSF